MYSVLNTHSSSWTEPMMKPVDPEPRHSRTPTWTNWALAASDSMTSAAAAAMQMAVERIMVLPPGTIRRPYQESGIRGQVSRCQGSGVRYQGSDAAAPDP